MPAERRAQSIVDVGFEHGLPPLNAVERRVELRCGRRRAQRGLSAGLYTLGPRKASTSSAMMEMAISCGLCAPMLMPIGEWMRLISSLAEAGLLEALRALGMIAPGAQRADVEAVRAHGELQRLVVDMADVRQRHDGGVGIEPDLRDGVLRPLGVEADAGKARLGGEGGARIDHHHLVAGDLHELRQDLADVRGADDEHARRRHHRVQEHLAVRRLHQLALAASKCCRMTASALRSSRPNNS